MNAQDFIRAVKDKGAKLPAGAVDAALRHWREKVQRWDHAAVRDCIGIAGTIAEITQDQGRAEREGRLPSWSTPLGQVVEQQMLAAIQEDVREIRRAMFGREDAPFRAERYQDAVAWLEFMDWRTTRHVLNAEEEERLRRIQAQISELQREAQRISGVFHTTRKYVQTLRYWRGEPGEYRTMLVKEHSAIFPLAHAIEWISEASGFPQSALFAYVAADVPPVLPRVRYELGWTAQPLPSGNDIPKRPRFVVHFEVADITEKELRDILRRARQQRGETAENAAFRQILAGMGGVPDGATLDFWRAVADQWQALGMSAKAGKRGPEIRLRQRWYELPEEQKRQLRKAPSKS